MKRIDGLSWISGREELGGGFVGFSTGNTEAQRVAGNARLGTVLVVQGGDFACHFLPVFGLSKIIDENKVAFEAAGIEPAQQWRDNSGVEIQAFPQVPYFILGGRTVEPFAEKQSQIAGGRGIRDRHRGACSLDDSNNFDDTLQFLSPADDPPFPGLVLAGHPGRMEAAAVAWNTPQKNSAGPSRAVDSSSTSFPRRN
jgi:hypothetical protein